LDVTYLKNILLLKNFYISLFTLAYPYLFVFVFVMCLCDDRIMCVLYGSRW